MAKPEAQYPYTDENGGLLFEVVRYPDKKFRQRRPDGDGGYIGNLDDVPRVLFRLPQLIAAVAAGEPIYIVEGEKDVLAVESAGGVATCNPGGAGKWSVGYADHLRGASVVVVQDKDDPGRRHAALVVASLRPVCHEVRIVEALEGKDVSDHLDAGHALDALVPVADKTEDASPGSLWLSGEELFTVEFESVSWVVEGLVAAGAVTELVGKVKTGKTSLALAMTSALIAGEQFLGRAVCSGPVLYLTEQGQSSFVAQARQFGLSNVTTDLHVMSRASAGGLDWRRVTEAAASRAREVGAVLIVVDTFSVWAGFKDEDESNSGPAQQASKLAVGLASETGAGVLLVRHSRKGGGSIADAGRGSSAISGASDIILRLRLADGQGPNTRRVLEGVGRFDGVSAHLVIDYEDDRYRVIGDTPDAIRVAGREQVLEALSAGSRTTPELVAETGVTLTTIKRVLKQLTDEDVVISEGGHGKTNRANLYTLKPTN